MPIIEFCGRPSTTLPASVSTVLHDFFSLAPCTIVNSYTTEFKFPLDHEEFAEDRELVMLGQGFGEEKYTDPLARPEVAHLLET